MKTSRKIIIVTLFIVGLVIFLYPSISNYVSIRNMEHAIISYNGELSGYTDEMLKSEFEKSNQYNQDIKSSIIEDPFAQEAVVEPWDKYDEILNINGIMGYIDIPEIAIHLPIYHGVSEVSLRNGVGHIKASQVPVGGNGNHPILTGHRGLPEAKLFTNLDKMKLKDKFYIHVLGETLAYQVDQIKVIDPADVSSLKPVIGKDYVTLLTCTPYGINSQRLIIRGERCEYIEGEDVVEKEIPWNLYIYIIIALLSLIILFVYLKRKNKGRVNHAKNKNFK